MFFSLELTTVWTEMKKKKKTTSQAITFNFTQFCFTLKEMRKKKHSYQSVCDSTAKLDWWISFCTRKRQFQFTLLHQSRICLPIFFFFVFFVFRRFLFLFWDFVVLFPPLNIDRWLCCFLYFFNEFGCCCFHRHRSHAHVEHQQQQQTPMNCSTKIHQ